MLKRIFKHPKIKRFLLRLLHDPLNLADRQLAYAPPGHFLSPLPDADSIEDAIRDRAVLEEPSGIDLQTDQQLKLLQEISKFALEFNWPINSEEERRYWTNNTWFGPGDSVVLFGMLRKFQPRRVIEVGSGFSSALMLDTNDLFFSEKIQFTFIEPFPENRLAKLIRPTDKITTKIIPSTVQKVPLETFDQLEAGDILFIDSSHVAKAGSDVNHLLFKVLPRLKEGVLIHIHDIAYPLEYPAEWLRGGKAWNEIYLIRAFLQYNTSFEILFYNSYLAAKWGEIVNKNLPQFLQNPGSSLWLQSKVRTSA